MSESIVVPARFNGPEGSGNGGYAAGVMAGMLGVDAAEVTLRSPVPLDTPLDAVAEQGALRLLDRETLVAEATAAPGFALDVPVPVSVEQAREASAGYRGQRTGPFSRCFVCGLGREDALGVFAGPVAGSELVASPWTPPAELGGDDDGRVRAELVWAALDCPTYFAAYRGAERTVAFLGRMTGRVEALPRVGEEHAVIGWPIEVDRRKRLAGSAVLSAGGDVLARAAVLLIEPRSG